MPSPCAPTAARHRLLLLSVAVLACACSNPRDRPDGPGIHPSGWEAAEHIEFHGAWLRDNGYPLSECRECHGADYAGGIAEIGCGGNDCHTSGPEACGTCHGEGEDPRPVTAAHGSHADYCATCHPLPEAVEAVGHLDGSVALAFSGLATAAGATPAWNGTGCDGTYCHGSGAPGWEDQGPLGCDACHAEPPSSHDRFARVAGPDRCVDCHPDATGDRHLDGIVDVGESACNACHGGTDGAPPPALDGSVDPATVGVGAHTVHLDSALPGRIGRAVPCADCHAVPTTAGEAGHLDASAPSDVDLPLLGAYDPTTTTCTVWCHWDNEPGPIWTDDSGAEGACDACHGFPPITTRVGTPHPPSAPTDCVSCHSFTPTTHVDGEVNF